MKKHLFYSLLFVFLATAIVTLFGVIGVIQVKEPYLGWLVGAFLVEGAGVTYTLIKGTDFFSDETRKSESPAIDQQLPKGPFDKEKIAQIFWLGADLHSLVWHLNTTGDPDKIRFYLKQANSHMKLAGLKGHPLQEIMGQLYQEGRKKSAPDWTAEARRHYVQAVWNLLTKIVALIENQQGSSFVGEVPDDL
jgi:hypothetical protein